MFHFLFRVESLPPTKWPLCRYSIGYFFRRLHPYRLSRLLIFFYTFYYGFIAVYGPECLPAKYRYWLGDTILLSKVKYPKMERVYAFNCLVLGLFAISQFRLIADRQRNRPIKAFLMSILGVHEFSCDDETPEERRRLLQIYCFFRRVQQNIFWTKDEKEKRLNWIEQIQHFVFLYFAIIMQSGILYVLWQFDECLSFPFLIFISTQLQTVASISVLLHGMAILITIGLCLTFTEKQNDFICKKWRQVNRTLASQKSSSNWKSVYGILQMQTLLRQHTELLSMTGKLNSFISRPIVCFIPVFVPLTQDIIFLLVQDVYFGNKMTRLYMVYLLLALALVALFLNCYVAIYQIARFNGKCLRIQREMSHSYVHCLYRRQCTSIKWKVSLNLELLQTDKPRDGIYIGTICLLTRSVAAKFALLYCRYTILTWKSLLYRFQIFN